VVSDGVPVYSPGRRRKKKARQIISAIALVPCAADAKAAKAITCCRIWMGIGFTRLGGGSAREYPRSWRCKRKSIWPCASWRGSWVPSAENVWPMARSESSTVRDLTG
jgi:hypothetical protein